MSAPISKENETWIYNLPEKALVKWAKENVILDHFQDGSIEAQFRFVGSTCGFTGHSIDFEFRVKLSSLSDGRRVTKTSCRPSANDRGAVQMCAYITHSDQFLKSINAYHPRLGETLDACILWAPEIIPAGCLCNEQALNHKWRNAYQTIHYAISLKEKEPCGEAQNQ
ncbi:MAG: hypothetical protein HQM13_19630 [SAR324 cluster bacterium]|nr:hypothetical protein [SAR324 cluster bacterium]